MRSLAMFAAIFACTFASGASAQQTSQTSDTFGRPNAWDAARNPALTEEFAIHVAARRLLTEADELDPENGSFADPSSRAEAPTLRARAIGMLSTAIRDGATDPRLQFDLGEALYAQKHDAAAADILGKALAAHPSGDGSHSAWLTYAFANSKLDRPELECEGWNKYLADEPDPSRRIVPLLNRAEANMRGHRLTEAIDDYRAVETLSGTVGGTTDTGVLAVWGLALALDRQGDAHGAAEQARMASRMDPEDPLRQRRPVIDSSGVYFVPAYEKFWYLALAATEDAKQASTAEASAKAWAHAVVLWEAYVEPAQKIEHPEAWNAIALRHLDAAEKQLKQAEIKAKAEAKKPAKRGYVPDPDEITPVLQQIRPVRSPPSAPVAKHK